MNAGNLRMTHFHLLSIKQLFRKKQENIRVVHDLIEIKLKFVATKSTVNPFCWVFCICFILESTRASNYPRSPTSCRVISAKGDFVLGDVGTSQMSASLKFTLDTIHFGCRGTHLEIDS